MGTFQSNLVNAFTDSFVAAALKNNRIHPTHTHEKLSHGQEYFVNILNEFQSVSKILHSILLFCFL